MVGWSVGHKLLLVKIRSRAWNKFKSVTYTNTCFCVHTLLVLTNTRKFVLNQKSHKNDLPALGHKVQQARTLTLSEAAVRSRSGQSAFKRGLMKQLCLTQLDFTVTMVNLWWTMGELSSKLLDVKCFIINRRTAYFLSLTADVTTQRHRCKPVILYFSSSLFVRGFLRKVFQEKQGWEDRL